MDNVWPWLAVAGLGALHGLNPATGWALAAAWGLRPHHRARVLRALLPIAVGHLASVALMAGAVVWGLSLDRSTWLLLAGGLFVLALALHLPVRTHRAAREPAGHAGLALWSFMMSTAHGAGLMLVPALMPLCAGSPSGSGVVQGPLTLALVALLVHTAAMLAVTGLMATGVCSAVVAGTGLLMSRRRSPLPR